MKWPHGLRDLEKEEAIAGLIEQSAGSNKNTFYHLITFNSYSCIFSLFFCVLKTFHLIMKYSISRVTELHRRLDCFDGRVEDGSVA